ncbi:hypothetical protein M406DRAFT_338244 [Cryphonectria parasitica EP155]|uniref:Nudix hydrolase domain-containing protein n=1 Tax=Cryphonectria parasitica (strain ATCC 38755 / EP155) TaxID=660469 RepID=A0A9P4Y6P7_CRYP1|nr:uncharacterized protein M406DRAFT_338244 [Cryphonectria parasitica EP155]KAF3767486.1 hypothetical protein M406DRAFT_338244 [Cryphonectria parasitica EP155]
MATSRLTSRDLLDRCDGFPLVEREPERYAKMMNDLYTVIWEDEKGTFPIGYMLSSVFEEIKKVPASIRGEIVFNPYDRTVKMFHRPATERMRTDLVAATTHYLRMHRTFKILGNWRNELWPVYGRSGELLFSMERSSMGLWGYMRYGIHLIAYVRCPTAPHGIKLWVPKRSKLKNAWPGMFDNTVAGGLTTGEEPLECVIREADEEASLPEYIIREHAKLAGTIRYIYTTEQRPGIDDGYIYPECQWVYDVELPDDVVPAPNDGEVESFSLCTVDEVREQLAAGRWKPNCAVIILDFFIRMGILTPDNEPDCDEIETRLRRKMPFPGTFEEDE